MSGKLLEGTGAAQLPESDDESFESWMVRRFGRRLFDLFFKSYSENSGTSRAAN